MLLILDSRPWP